VTLRGILRRSNGVHAPALDGATAWLNSPALGAEDLHGRVAVYDFCTYTCVNWLRTLPYVKAWAGRYRDHGLVVVGVHTPEFEFEHVPDNVRQALTALGIGYPIALDNDYRIWRAFDNHYWPALYIAGSDAVIEHHHFGEGGYKESELVIQRLLVEAGQTGVPEGFADVDPVGVELGAMNFVISPETYLGADRGIGFIARRGDARGYVIPDDLHLNNWAIDGNWSPRRDSIVLESGRGTVAFRFRARDVNLVLASRNGAVPFCVNVDGHPPGSEHGLDCDEDGRGVLSLPRMYQLVRAGDRIVERTFEITFQRSGVGAYVFTFG
jgi:hypothetical protein